MYCRHCGAEMPETQAVCEACGEKNPMPKKFNWAVVVAAICCVAISAGLVATVLMGMNPTPATPGSALTDRTSYTGTKDEVMAALDTVVATAGEFELTNRELQIAYWTSIYDFLTFYGEYATMWVDFTQPLDQQYIDTTMSTTWQQYFLEAAITSWRRYEILVALAKEDNQPMSAELETWFADLPNQLKATVSQYGFNSVDEMVAYDYGECSDYAAYEAYMKLYYYSDEKYERLYNSITLTEAQLEAYYSENQSSIESSGYGKNAGSIVNVRHILIAPGTDAEKPFTEEQWTAAQNRAQALLNTWLQGSADEDAFAALAKTNSSCSSAAQGGLIENIVKGQMVAEFEEWCMEPHEYGDYGIVKTSYGYHLMFYVDGMELWRSAAESGLRSEKINEVLNAKEAQSPLKVQYDKIMLAEGKFG